MPQTLEKYRRIDRRKNWLASIAVALSLALLLAILLKALLLAIGEPMLPSPVRDVAVFALILFVPCLSAGMRIGSSLIARYDGEVMRSPPATEPGSKRAGPLDAVQQHAWAALESWCRAGAGDGRSPFWRPRQLPDVPERFSLAVMVGGNSGARSQLAETFALRLDRNDELAALSADSRLKGMCLKLAVKWHELWWWRKRHPRQPWDCGYVLEHPAAMARLAHFRPRRPTLMIADELRNDSLRQILHALGTAQAGFGHPVRLLVIDAALPSMLELHFDTDTQWGHTPVHDLGQVSVIDLSGTRMADNGERRPPP
ncbi:hypothetical protein [Thauera linaloolentis]|uniref:Uncharacterized protein n=1 Tax=Thauera linaloolentis (strain DSM 12138 / JCM 21573 / CCUG 41526 / CIP 105981 / IAM 15112 / NBRC 102519 / 47Lol) TaxID=1123367 RepID=N6XSI3_THAL4|nr:hypothetical protein [Thauera linaloolentis]ENO84711.1 hypothetical protein C666_16720 [Thauera linaloolentis 47Lol = DSM 12138]MCM8567430.1 hypothetical protein [Thauera linaloolentis]